VTVLEQAGDRTRVQLGEDVDDQQVLHAALTAGPVREFSRHRPGLTELYRDVVRAPQHAESVPVTA
jgi:ABC-2 type transport system ATP-binding protein